MRVARVRTVRIASQIGPVGGRRIDEARWPCADRRALFARNGGRWGIGGPLEEHERCRYLGGMPWHLGALADLVDTKSRALEDVGEGQAAFADHLSQRLGIGSVRALSFRSHRSG